MNTIQQLLLTIGLMAAGFVAYDLMTSKPARESDPPVVMDSGDLERRIEALESAEREGPSLRPMVAPSDAPERLTRLEKRVAALERSRGLAAQEDGPVSGSSDGPHPEGPLAAEEGGSATPGSTEAKTEFDKKVEDAVARLRRAEARARVDGVLDRLGIKMTEEQRKKFEVALDAHRNAVRETIGKARAEGLPRSEVRPLIEGLAAEFSTSLQTFLPAADADALAGETRSLVGPPGPGGPGGGGGPGRR